MTRTMLAALAAVFAVTAVVGRTAAHADPPIPINLNFPASDGMSVTDLLKVIAMETGEVLLPDNSVVGAVGAIHTTQSSVVDALNFLKAYEPGLTWQIVYYPSSSNNEPAGEDLYKGILLLQGLNLDGLVLPPQGDDKVMLSFKRQNYTTPDQEKAEEQGFRPYYLISDPTNRAQMIKAAAKPSTTPPAMVADKPGHFLTSLNDLENQVAQMSPQQQVAALNEMANTSRQIMANLSPQVLTALKNQNSGQRQTLPAQ